MNDKMRRHRLLLVGFVLLCFAQHASAQQTVVAASRSIDWSKAGVTGGIPARLTICATLNPGATAAQISTALTNCPAGQTVFLNAGTYNLTSGNIKTIGKSNVTLRGAGADQTLLIFTSSADCWGQPSVVCFRAVDNNYAGGGGGGVDNSATVTGAGPWPKGTTQVTLSNTTNLAVGGIMILDQVDDLSDGGVIYNCEQSATLSPSQNPPCNDDSGATGGDSGAQR